MLEQERIHVHNFSLLFEQMCSIVAIADTQNAEETLRQLILQSLVVRSNEKFQNSIQLKQVIDNIFGLHIPEYQIQAGLDWLIDHEYVQQNPNGNLILPPQVRSDLQKRIEEAKNLENKVKQEWFNDISVSFPLLRIDRAWIALQSYLTKAFRRHGIQTVALLDPSIDAASEAPIRKGKGISASLQLLQGPCNAGILC